MLMGNRKLYESNKLKLWKDTGVIIFIDFIEMTTWLYSLSGFEVYLHE